MDTLRKQVHRARRRLAIQEFLRVCPWCWSVALLLAVLAIAADKVWPMGVVYWQWGAGAVGLGAVLALVWTRYTWKTELATALELDRRFGLRERVSSTLALDDAARETPAGRALILDAQRRIERLEVSDRFAFSLHRWTLLPLVPAALAFVVAVFVPAIGENPAVATSQVDVEKKQVKTSAEALRKKLAQRKKDAQEKGLKDAEDLFERLQRETKQMSDAKEQNREQALVKLNDLAKDLEKRRTALNNGEALKERLNQLKDLQSGPGDDLAKALQNGDFEQAANQLKQLRQKLEQGQLDDEAKAALAKQLADMEQKLRQMAEAHQKMQEQLKEQIAQARAAGRTQEANELEKQLAKLAQQAPQMNDLEKLAEKMGQCAECLQHGDKQGAMAGLDDLQAEMNQLKQQLDELAMLDEALDEIGQCKDGMCQGLGQGQQGDKPGNGLGRGRGQGARPEEEGQTGSYDSRVKQKHGRGAAVMAGLVDGPNAKGQVQEEIKRQLQSARTEEADPLTGQQLPSGYQDHVRTYFDTLREGREK